MNKVCNYCHEEKDIALFVPKKRRCKQCHSVKCKIYYNKNKDKIQEINKNWSLEKVLQIARSCKNCKEMQKKSSHAYKLFLDYGYNKAFFGV